MMKTDSLLGYALLGLVHQEPMSGYALRSLFATTAMGTFSDSPGAIYPALQRLESRGWVKGKAEASAGLRKRRVYTATAQGVRALKDWLKEPVERQDVVRNTAKLMLRFAFIDHALGADTAARFLKQYAHATSQYVGELQQFLGSEDGQKMQLSARLAVDHGIQEYKARLKWAVKSLAIYQQMEKQS
jgi:DNA-binding PadR family transcriptional regulator